MSFLDSLKSQTSSLFGTTDTSSTTPTTTVGGRRRRRKTGRKSTCGGSALGAAALPFGLLGIQQMFKTRRSKTGKKRSRFTRRRRSRRF